MKRLATLLFLAAGATVASIAAGGTLSPVHAEPGPHLWAVDPDKGGVRKVPVRVEIIDGSTIHVTGSQDRDGVWRLGHDAPEIYEARCDAEYLLGQEAAAALKLLAADPRAELRGGEMKDKHGRRMGVLEIAGVPLSSILVAEGVAHYERRRSEYTVYYDGLLKRTDWCSFLATYGRPRKSCHLGPALPVGVPC